MYGFVRGVSGIPNGMLEIPCTSLIDTVSANLNVL